MADYQFNTDLSPKVQGTNFGDMLNMARGVQQYQQAEQVNPLALRQQQAQTALAEQTLQPKVQQEQTLAKQGQFNLGKDEILFDSQLFGGIARNPKILAAEADPTNPEKKKAAQQLIDHHFETMKALGRPAERVEVLRNHFKNADPSQYSNDFLTLRNMGMGAVNQQAQVSGLEQVKGNDVYGNPLTEVTNPATGEKYQKRLPFAGSEQGMRYAPGESTKSLETMMEERETAKNQASAISPALQNISSIRKALKVAQTGRGSEAIANLQSVFGNLAGSTAEEKAAAARDIIQKSVADLALQKNAALQGKFAADLQGAQNSLAEAGKNPTAIAKALDQLEPLLQHVSLYQQGLEKAIAKNNGDVQVKRKFDNEMLKTFDVKALMAYNAYKSGDKKSFNDAISGMSQQEKNKIFDDVAKYARLSNGDL